MGEKEETVEIEKPELRAISNLGRAASRVIRELEADEELEEGNENEGRESC